LNRNLQLNSVPADAVLRRNRDATCSFAGIIIFIKKQLVVLTVSFLF
jgi:hypothetical protein